MFENKNTKRNAWTKSTEGMEYFKLKEYLEKLSSTQNKPIEELEVVVYGYYINDLDNGKAVTIITDDAMLNMPSHCLEAFETMTEEENEAIKNGLLKLTKFKKHTVKRFKQETIYFEYEEVK